MTNGTATGYAIMAAKLIGLTDEQIEKLERAMYIVMDIHTEGEAEEVWRNT